MFDIIFKTDEKRRSYLKNLVAIAKLDNKITKKEFKFIISVGNKVGVSETEIKTMISRTTKVNVYKPETVELTLDYIYDLVSMSLADGIIDEAEMDMVISIAEKLGLNPVTSGVIVRQVFVLLEAGNSKDDIFSNLKSNVLY